MIRAKVILKNKNEFEVEIDSYIINREAEWIKFVDKSFNNGRREIVVPLKNVYKIIMLYYFNGNTVEFEEHIFGLGVIDI